MTRSKRSPSCRAPGASRIVILCSWRIGTQAHSLRNSISTSRPSGLIARFSDRRNAWGWASSWYTSTISARSIARSGSRIVAVRARARRWTRHMLELLLISASISRLDLGRGDAPARSDRLAEKHRVVPGSGADIRDDLPARGLQRRNRPGWRLFGLTLNTFEPGRALVSHDACDRPAGDRMCRLRERDTCGSRDDRDDADHAREAARHRLLPVLR